MDMIIRYDESIINQCVTRFSLSNEVIHFFTNTRHERTPKKVVAMCSFLEKHEINKLNVTLCPDKLTCFTHVIAKKNLGRPIISKCSLSQRTMKSKSKRYVIPKSCSRLVIGWVRMQTLCQWGIKKSHHTKNKKNTSPTISFCLVGG